jgi:hypothetical protein
MMLPLLLGLVVGATPSTEGLANPSSAVNQTLEPEWVRAAPLAEVKVNDEARVKRFVGALAGGLVGAAATMAWLPLGDAPGAFVISPVQAALTFLTPLMALTGAFLGYQVMGGDGGLVTSWASILPAGLALSLLLFTVPPELGSVAAFMPQVATGVVLLAAVSALALDLRERQLGVLGSRRAEGSAPGARVAAEGLLTLVSLAASIFQAALGIAFAGSLEGRIVLGVGLGALGAAGTALTTWAVHRSVNGKGSLLASALGLFLGAGGGALAATLTLFAVAPSSRLGSSLGTLGPLIAIAVPTLAATMTSTLAIEWSHTNAVGSDDTASLSFGAAPTAGGAMVAAGLRF